MNARGKNGESKTMTELPPVIIEYIKDDSIHSERRVAEATELIFRMLLLAKKRGRPAKNSEEIDDAA